MLVLLTIRINNMKQLDRSSIQGCIDLHIHSSFSDGTDTPAQIVRSAKQLGLAAIAITDHDTIDGVAEAEAAGLECGLEVIPGCEIAAETPYGEMHILAFWPDLENADFLQFLESQRLMRHARNSEILEKLKKFAINIDLAELAANSGGKLNSIGRPHIAKSLVSKKFALSIPDAFNKYLAAGRKAYVERKLMPPIEVFSVLKKAGATTIFAHPMALPAPLSWFEEQIANFSNLGLLDGLEAYHPEHDAAKLATTVGLAKKYKLLLSGGSDYHGKVKPTIYLGKGTGALRVPYRLLELLEESRGL